MLFRSVANLLSLPAHSNLGNVGLDDELSRLLVERRLLLLELVRTLLGLPPIPALALRIAEPAEATRNRTLSFIPISFWIWFVFFWSCVRSNATARRQLPYPSTARKVELTLDPVLVHAERVVDERLTREPLLLRRLDEVDVAALLGLEELNVDSHLV